MTKKQIEAHQREMARKRGGDAAPKQPEPADAVRRDLDDPAVQEDVLFPQGVEVQIGRKPSRIFPLPAYEQMAVMFSFMPRLQDAERHQTEISYTAKPWDNLTVQEKSAIVALRFARVYAENELIAADFRRFIARSEHAADAQPDDNELSSRADEMRRDLRPNELSILIPAFLIINEVFGRPTMPAIPPAK